MVEVGGTLVLLCTIQPSYTGPYNSSEICFMHYGEPLCTAPHVRVVNSTSAELRYVNVTHNNSGHFRCRLRDLTSMQMRASQSVTVASTYHSLIPHLLSVAPYFVLRTLPLFKLLCPRP